MNKQKLEGRFNAQKQEFLSILKEEGNYIEYCDEKGFMYELVKPIYGILNKIQLSIKGGKILVHDTEKIS
ncbi:hypothetical protein [Viridibacillus arvi]|uniref:hypothetical protein n=1 Tax=Viridibacillus arvi TaxID=263475 RepID=UPI003D2AFFCF